MTMARPRSLKIIRRLRSTRSTQAPISRPKRRYGRNVAAVAAARLRAEPVSLKTRSGRAKAVNELPRLEIVSPVQNFQNSNLVRVLRSEERRVGKECRW